MDRGTLISIALIIASVIGVKMVSVVYTSSGVSKPVGEFNTSKPKRLYDIDGNPIDLKTGKPIQNVTPYRPPEARSPAQPPSAQETNATKPTPKELRATLGVEL
ncbi:MAG: hypothetical protein LBQ52_01285 [Helicobacteraceae bacterium]|jgi:hypothetical protein|nr:hypothetical protein [Helicobacteraceae bacterium]